MGQDAKMQLAKCPRLDGEVNVLPGFPSVQTYKDVVLEQWALYDVSRQLIPGSGFHRGIPEYAIIGGASATKYVAARVWNRLPPGDYFWLGPFHMHFGHFLVSTLARAWAFRDHVRPNTKIVYVGGSTPNDLFKIEFIRECLTALGVTAEQMLQVAGPAYFPQITVPAPSFVENHSVFQSHLATLREIAGPEDEPESGGSETPVYISKQNLASGVRSIINEDELTLALRNFGFEIAFPETLPFRQQLHFWRQHRNVIGFASSAFHVAAFFRNKQLCTISHDAYASTNQVLLDAASGNRNLYLCILDGLVSRGPSQHFSDTVEINDPASLAFSISQLAERLYESRIVHPQRLSPEPRTLSQSVFVDEPFGTNLARDGKATQSSTYEIDEGHNRTADGALSGRLTGFYQCATALEYRPWWQVELPQISTLFEVRVFNRCENKIAQARLNNVVIQLSMDGATWITAGTRAEPGMAGGYDGVPYRWLAPPGVAARHVRLQLPGTSYLNLDQVEIFGERFERLQVVSS
jgi:capsular polysaccharide biosynthesis protein